MFDDPLRRLEARLLTPVARAIGPRVPPLAVTAVGLAVGLGAAWCAWRGLYWAGLAAWLLNRTLDGLDGTLARTHGGQSDLGGYLDLLADFAVYAAVPIGFALAEPADATRAHVALALLATFYVNGAGWLYLSAVLERRGRGAAARGEPTSITMPAGLVAGAETIVLYAVAFAWPAGATATFAVMAGLVALTIAQRIGWAVRSLGPAGTGE
ncbi:MAG TPA: CDP-alcohol phosphatidyltransferase family protein [Gemmatirosa sp.]|jgi:phosphatidylglycerophosphate synthase|nr:CDP-alcohol phosphatidyltransferase family protein [Gemmatirosa sp.]